MDRALLGNRLKIQYPEGPIKPLNKVHHPRLRTATSCSLDKSSTIKTKLIINHPAPSPQRSWIVRSSDRVSFDTPTVPCQIRHHETVQTSAPSVPMIPCMWCHDKAAVHLRKIKLQICHLPGVPFIYSSFVLIWLSFLDILQLTLIMFGFKAPKVYIWKTQQQ